MSKTEGFIYFLRADNGLTKIGKSTKPKRRLASIQTACPCSTELVRVEPAIDMDEAERNLHKLFANQRVRGEWFDISLEVTMQAVIDCEPRVKASIEKYPNQSCRREKKYPPARKISPVKCRLAIVHAKKEARDGVKIPYRVVCGATGLSSGVLVHLMNDNWDRMAMKTLDALCKYYECGVGDILDFEPNTPKAGAINE